ncbi:WD40 repeat-like protein [Linnemannia elongata AG-77]|uniref:WD40 repeat-like protein n=1 Tax=Linnemannia elongata AG-77 TaxID=1314771 RepID=A0A197K1A5_9FUNG|nr:WD40 repeat-like protein [Linnemannia elongata AG-77]
MIFAENVPKPTMTTELPRFQQRIEATQQLVHCNALLLQDTLFSPQFATVKDADSAGSLVLQEPTLKKTELDWLETTKKDPMEVDRLRWLVSRLVEQFVADDNKDSTKIAEIVALGRVLEKEYYRKLLSTFIKEFDDACILDVDVLQGLVQLAQDTSPGYLEADDLVKILGTIRERLEGTHHQSTQHAYHLTLAVSKILDVMAEHKVQDLNRVLQHEPLSAVLLGLKDSSDPYLMYQACYAFQALQYVPDDESALQTVWRHSTGVVDGLVKVTAAFKLDLVSVLEGLSSLQEALGGTISVAGTVYEGICSLMESGRGVLDSLKEGLGSGQKRPWYPAVRAAYAFAQAGKLKDLKVLIFEAPCRRDPLFQWGICQLLGEMAMDPAWAVSARQQSVSLLGHLCQHDQDWGQDESVKAWMLTIITKLSKLRASSDQAVSETARSVLQDLTVDQSVLIKDPYPLMSRLPIPDASPLLAKVQNIQYLEYELSKFRLQRLEEVKLPVYISPMAKANPQARDDELFPLKEKVQEFLASDRQVMLILGDSGAGKSTFNKYLESELLRTYTRGGPIPLFINLSAIDEPDRDMIEKQLRSDNFNDEQIRELKLYRQFILICDGYDESQQLANLHKTNMLNQPGQWNTKMVISCRTQYLGQDYRNRFIPQSRDHYARPAVDLFQEAVITPFSKEQIQSYIEQYIPLEPRTWTTKDYMDRLTIIPNLMDLVRNPFVLTLALEALPLVIEGKQDLSVIDITRVQLYDTFVKHWLDVNKRRLESNSLSVKDRETLEQLLEAGFTSMGVDYSIGLALAIFEKQDGKPVVRYTHLKDKNTWRVDFFGPDPEVRLLRESSPLTRSGSLFRFLHRSMQEYFYSRTVFNPSCHDNHDEFAPHPDIGSTDPALLEAENPLFKRSLLVEPSVIQFLSERVKQHPDFEKQLLTVIEQSKADASASTAAANAITILVRAGVRFNSADLRGIRISGADLSDGQFDSTQFQGADLRKVNFARSWLRQADFSNAQMGGVQFEELPYLQECTAVEAVAFSPNGKLFAVALRDGSLLTYDTTTWIQVHQHKEQKRMSTIAFSPNNQHLAFEIRDNTCRLWDTISGETLLVMEGHTNWVTSVAFSPSGKQIASASEDNTIRLWSSETGECLFVLNGHEKAVLSVAYSTDGRRLISGSRDGTIRVWDPKTGASEAGWVIPRVGASCVALSANGLQLAVTSSRRGEIHLMNAITGESGQILSDDTTAITHISSSPIGELIVTSSKDNIVRLWDTSTGQLISRFSGHSNRITACTFSPDGLKIASGDVGGIIQLREVSANRPSSITQKRAEATAAYSHDGLFIISYHDDYTIQRWNSSSGASRSIPFSSTFDVESVAISPNGHWFAHGCRNGNIRLLNDRTDVVERILLGSSHHSIVEMSFSRCGRWLATCDSDWVARLWDLDRADDQGIVVAETVDPYRSRPYVVFSPVGDQITVILLSRSSRLRLFDLQSTDFRQPLKELCVSDTLLSANYSPDGQRLVLGTGTSSILLWDLQSDKANINLEGHTDSVKCVVYSPCGKWILSGSRDKTVRLWSGEVDSWSCVAVINGYSEAVTSVAWNPVVPLEFVTGSEDGSVRLWRISGAEAGNLSVRMQWGSHIGQLCAADLTFKGAVDLSPIYRKLLVQRGAINDSLLPEGDEPEEGKGE